MQNYVANQEADWLIGHKAIARYIGISLRTVSHWREWHKLPVTNLPDGRVATSKSLLDQWLMSREDCIGRMNQSPGRPRKVDTKEQGVTGDSSSD